MNSNPNPNTLRQTAAGYAEDALDSGRQFAHDAYERAGERARDLRAGMRHMANRGMSGMSDAAGAAQRRAAEYAQATGRYVAEQPVKSALIAAAVGAAVAALVLAMRRSSQRDIY
jgi:ElaB/YqjD/DUF883 family membrane-anchored ribosome-binding protein